MKKIILISMLILLIFAVSITSAANEVYFYPDPAYVPECGNAHVQIRMNVTDTIDTWSTMVEFDDIYIDITYVDFTGAFIQQPYANWAHHGDYITLAGVGLESVTGDYLLATLFIVCEDNSCCVSTLNFTGDENNERVISGAPEITVYPATWTNGSAQCIECGDVDCDRNINLLDSIEIYNKVINPEYSLNLPCVADVDCSGTYEIPHITMVDAFEIYNRVINPSYVLSCCELYE